MLATIASWSPPCEASTLSPVDFQARNLRVALGVFDASVDYALFDRLSLGAYVIYQVDQAPDLAHAVVEREWALRSTCRLWEHPTGVQLGITLSGGQTSEAKLMLATGTPTAPQDAYFYFPWFQPALNLTLPMGIPHLRGRVMVGPFFGRPFMTSYFPMLALQLLWPNIELAYRIADHHEITLGGNSLLGWRGTF